MMMPFKQFSVALKPVVVKCFWFAFDLFHYAIWNLPLRMLMRSVFYFKLCIVIKYLYPFDTFIPLPSRLHIHASIFVSSGLAVTCWLAK